MKLHIQCQYLENYGAHDWDGKGSCPQRWKFKGGEDYFVLNISKGEEDRVVEEVRHKVEWKDNGSQQYIVGYGLVADDSLTEFERSQLEYEGYIGTPSITLTYKETA